MDTAQQLADVALQQQKLAHLSFGQRAYAQAAEAFSLAAKHFSSAVTRLGSNQEAEAARLKSVWRQHAIECLTRVISIHEGNPQHLARAEKDLADLYEEQSDFGAASDHHLNAAYNYALIKNNNMNRGCMIKVADLRAFQSRNYAIASTGYGARRRGVRKVLHDVPVFRSVTQVHVINEDETSVCKSKH